MLTCNRLLKEEDLTYMQFKKKYCAKPVDPKEEAESFLKMLPSIQKKGSSHSVTNYAPDVFNEEKDLSRKDSEVKDFSDKRASIEHL